MWSKSIVEDNQRPQKFATLPRNVLWDEDEDEDVMCNTSIGVTVCSACFLVCVENALFKFQPGGTELLEELNDSQILLPELDRIVFDFAYCIDLEPKKESKSASRKSNNKKQRKV